MPKIGRFTGPSNTQAVVEDQALYYPRTDVVLAGSASDLHVGGDLHLDGQGLERRLAIAHLANQTTASTSFVDLPGATFTLTNPTPANLDLIFDVPLSIDTSGQKALFQVLAGSTVIGSREIPNTITANQSCFLAFRFALPNPLYTPVAGASVTYKVQWRSSGGAGIAVVTEFGVPINTGFFEAVRV